MPVFGAAALLDISAQFRAAEPEDPAGWLAYLHHDGLAAIPYPFREVLYRGQNTRFLPFWSSMARGLDIPSGKMFEMPIQSQAQLVFRLAQSWWFIRELESHPLTEYAREHKIHLNGMALAQHYGIPTGYLDLTHDFDVAAFFATCRWSGKRWEPVVNGTGVVYRVELSQVKDALETFQPLGPQPLPRPAEQRAWVVELPLVPSFDGWPGVKAMEFYHDESVGKHFLDQFAGGARLFPPDPLAKLASDILGAADIPTELIDRAIDSFAADPLGIRPDDRQVVREAVAVFHSLGVSRNILTDDAIEPYLADFEIRKQRLAETRVKVRPVRVEPA